MSRAPRLLSFAALLSACAFRPPAQVPALVAAEGPVEIVPLPAGTPLAVALRAGSAHDPPGREGVAWVTAHAIAAAAGAEVEVGPEIVVFRLTPDQAPALATAFASPLGEEAVARARAAALAALEALDCRALASRAWDAWIYAGHPYGHAPEGRTSVLPTLTTAEVHAFRDARYVRSVAVLGVPADARVDPAMFEVLPPLLSRSPVPSVVQPLPEARVLAVAAPDQRCAVVGHPASTPSGAVELQVAASLESGGVTAGARRQARRLAAVPIPPGRDPAYWTADLLGSGWLPVWRASRVLAPDPGLPVDQALVDALLARDPWPSLARPIGALAHPDPVASDLRIATPADLDATLAAWLTPAETRAVVVLPPDELRGLESLGAAVVQPTVTRTELLR